MADHRRQPTAEEAYAAAGTASDPMSQKLRQFAAQVSSVTSSQQRILRRAAPRRRGRRRRRKWYRGNALRRTRSEPPPNAAGRRPRRPGSPRRKARAAAVVHEVARRISGSLAGVDPRDAVMAAPPAQRYTMATGMYMTSLSDGEQDDEPSVSRSGVPRGESFLGFDVDAERTKVAQANGSADSGLSWVEFLKEGAATKPDAAAASAGGGGGGGGGGDDDGGGEEMSWEDFLREMGKKKQGGK